MGNSLPLTNRKTGKFMLGERVDTAVLISSVFTVLYFLVLFRSGHMNVIYDTAVDRLMASGDMIGYPNAHVLFINYVIGCIMAFLYRVLPMWNWYSLLLLAAIYFGLWSSLYRITALIGNGKIICQMAGAALTLFFFHLFFYSSIMSIYFFNCALVAGVCAFFYIIFADELRPRDIVICITLLVLCSGIRYSLFKELVPFFGIAFITRYFIFKKRKYLILLSFLLLVIIGGMKFIDQHAYTGIYEEERVINHHRAAIQDYGKWPTYEGHEEFFAGLGMDEDEYNVMLDCWGLSNHLDVKTLTAIQEKYEEENISDEGKQEQVDTLITKMFDEDYTQAFWRLEVFSILCGLILILKKKDWKMLVCYLGTFFTVAGEIWYLAYRGRMPVRVTFGPLLILMMTGFAYIVQYRTEWLQVVKPAIVRTAWLIAVILCLYGGYCNIVTNHQVYEEEYVDIAKKLTLTQYILRDQNNVYFYHGIYDYLDLYNPTKRNYSGWGGWISETIDWKTMLMGDYDNLWDALAYRDDIRLILNEDVIKIYLSYLNNHGYSCSAASERVIVDHDGSYFELWRIISNE